MNGCYGHAAITFYTRLRAIKALLFYISLIRDNCGKIFLKRRKYAIKLVSSVHVKCAFTV